MKKFLLTYGMIFFFAVAAFAQDNSSNEQKPEGGRLEALKIAYISKKLNLTPTEAEKFWPVYNLYAAEIKQVRKEAILNNEPEISTEEKVLNIRKKYNGEFIKALGSQRADEFFRGEKEFGALVAKEMMQRRNLRMQRHPLLRQ